ncbi:hypothetical protein MNBD_UNCLBAC01-884 [hydrothermal vent metagenome]|uniref:Endonuclease/exonuclease/phosphatase domain-containing protein n=1 Tax=hydrothermal vent metagenome TaxID=652676 RepID=A0A3B1E4B0_9ZZZZ
MVNLHKHIFGLRKFRFKGVCRNYTHGSVPRYAQSNINFLKNKFLKKSLKVISYNIEFAQKVPEAIELLRGHDDLNGADIILLQEMDLKGVKCIANALQYNYVYYPAVIHPMHEKDFGNAILSKWPIVEDQKIIFSNKKAKSLQRIAVGATVQIGNKKVLVFSLHLAIFECTNTRKKHLDLIFKNISPDIDCCIIGGDFNTFTKKGIREIRSCFNNFDFKLATKKITWTNRYWYLLYKKFILDHIYAKGMEIIGAGKVINKKISDHSPIWTELEFLNN